MDIISLYEFGYDPPGSHDVHRAQRGPRRTICCFLQQPSTHSHDGQRNCGGASLHFEERGVDAELAVVSLTSADPHVSNRGVCDALDQTLCQLAVHRLNEL